MNTNFQFVKISEISVKVFWLWYLCAFASLRETLLGGQRVLPAKSRESYRNRTATYQKIYPASRGSLTPHYKIHKLFEFSGRLAILPSWNGTHATKSGIV